MYNLYIIYNRKVNAYERPISSQDDPNEFIEHVHRDYLASGNIEKAKILECDVYHVGTYDDNLGKIDLIDKNLIISCADFEKPIDQKAGA